MQKVDWEAVFDADVALAEMERERKPKDMSFFQFLRACYAAVSP